MKRYVVWGFVASVLAGAVAACVSLFGGASDELRQRVLGSAIVILLAGLMAMACASGIVRGGVVARVGVASAIVTALLSLVGIWGELQDQAFGRAVLTLGLLALSAAFATLLRCATLRPAHRWVTVATIVCAGILVSLALASTWELVELRAVAEPITALLVLAGAGTIVAWALHLVTLSPPGSSAFDAAVSAPQCRHCVSCGAPALDVAADGVRCRDCGASFRVSLPLSLTS